MSGEHELNFLIANSIYTLLVHEQEAKTYQKLRQSQPHQQPALLRYRRKSVATLYLQLSDSWLSSFCGVAQQHLQD